MKLLAEYLEHARQFVSLAGETEDDPRLKRRIRIEPSHHST